MSVSSDAILVFGFPVGREDEVPEWLIDVDGEEIDFDDFVCGPYEIDCDYSARRAKLGSCPADLTLYCSYDYPMFILGVRGTETRVAHGDFSEISSLDVPAEKISAFKSWCELSGIPYEEPKWLLVSMYG